VSVDAGDTSEIQVSMVPIRTNPSPTVSVQLVAVSQDDDAVHTVLDLEPDFAGLGVSGLSVTGVDVADSMPKMGTDSIILVGVVLALMAALLSLSIQKGVFLRRKR